jgi:hypothetical protein
VVELGCEPRSAGLSADLSTITLRRPLAGGPGLPHSDILLPEPFLLPTEDCTGDVRPVTAVSVQVPGALGAESCSLLTGES